MRFQQYINESNDIKLLHIVQALYDHCLPYLRQTAKLGYAEQLYSGRNDTRPVIYKFIRSDRQPMDTPKGLHDDWDMSFQRSFGWKPRSEGLFCTGRLSTANSYGSGAYSIFPMGDFKFIWSDRINDLYSKYEDSDVVLYYNGDLVLDSYELNDFRNSIFEEAYASWESDNPRPERMDYLDDDGKEDEDAYNEAMREWERTAEIEVEGEVEDKVRSYEREWYQNKKDEVEYEVENIADKYQDTNIIRAIESGHEIMVKAKSYIGISTLDSILRHDYRIMIYRFLQWYPWRVRPTAEHLIKFAKEMNMTKGNMNPAEKMFFGVEL